MPEISASQFTQDRLFDATDFDVASQPKGGLMGEDWYRGQMRDRRSPMGGVRARQRNFDRLPEEEQRLTTRPVAPNPDASNGYHPEKPGSDWNHAEGYIQQADDDLYEEMMANTPAQNPYAVEHYQRHGYTPTYRHQYPEAPTQIPTQEFGPGGSIATHQPSFQTNMTHAARMQDVQGLPPVSVKQFPSGLGLTDGNHRVTEALRNGRLWVDANVHHMDYNVKEPYDERYEGGDY